MSYTVNVKTAQSDGTRRVQDRHTDTAYAITNAGVLQLIHFSEYEKRWYVHQEIASNEWITVDGLRYLDDSSSLPGIDGSVLEGAQRD